MAASLEIRVEEGFHDGICLFIADEAAGHGQYVGIIVLTRQGSQFGRPTEGTAYALMLVHGHADTLSASADGNAVTAFAGFDGFSHRVCIVRIVTTLFTVSAEIFVGPTFGFEPLLHMLFQGKSGMVGTKSYGIHHFFFGIMKQVGHADDTTDTCPYVISVPWNRFRALPSLGGRHSLP